MDPPPGWEEFSSLSADQIDILIRIERVGASISMVAILLTITSFVSFKSMRTTPNVFIVCACIANLGACIASMIGYDGLEEGPNSSLCQAQAFFFEWFMQSDPWWSFAMSLNVFLVFFCNVNPTSFKKYTWIYCLVCYGGPLVPAVTLVSIRGDPRGPVFGNAALWCWIRAEWSIVRMYSYYIPIWICIFLSLFIYLAVGFHVFHHRNQLKNITFTSSDQQEKSERGKKSSSRGSAEEGLTQRPEIYCTAVTEVHVTSYSLKRESQDAVSLPSPIYSRFAAGVCDPSWSIKPPPANGEENPIKFPPQFETVCYSDYVKERKTILQRLQGITSRVMSSIKTKLKRFDPVKMAYLRTSFIFGCAVLITWTPSSVNRLYSLSHRGRISFELSVASGCVLPLQGVWNSIIYFSTSWKILRRELPALKAKFRGQQLQRSARLGRGVETPGTRRDDFLSLDIPSARLGSSMRRNADDFELEDRI